MLDFEHSEDEADQQEPSPRVLQALSFINNEAEEGESDEEVDEAERSRQLAESVQLRSSDYVDPIEAVAEQWLARESARLEVSPPAEASRRVRKGPLKLSAYDEALESLSGTTDPVGQTSQPIRSESLSIPAVPHAVSDFLEKVSSNDVGSRNIKEDKAWQILNDYLLGSLTGDHVKSMLDDLGVGNEWDSLRIRIMQVEPGDNAAEAELRSQLDAMKKAEVFVDNAGDCSDIDEEIESVSDAPIYDSDTFDDLEPDVLGSEQLELRQFLRDVLGGINELEDWLIFYVRCRVSS